MSNFISKIAAKVGVQQNNKFDLSCDNITSNDFFICKPVYARELVPGSSINMQADMFTRLAPLQKPYYGGCKIVNRAFFVPYEYVWDDFHSLITSTVGKGNVIASHAPFATNDSLVGVFLHHSLSTVIDDEYSEDPWNYQAPAFDFAIQNVDAETYRLYKFTRLGQKVYDILLNLGYKIDFNALTDDDKNVRMSLLPLYSLVKVHFDWYRVTQFQINNPLEDLTNRDFLIPSVVQIRSLLNYVVTIPFERDYYTSAWVNPVGPNSALGANVDINLLDVTLSGKSVSRSRVSNGSPYGGVPTVNKSDGTSGVPYNFTQYLDTALHKATDFVKRYQLFGQRTMDIYKSIFGIDLSDSDLRRSIHVGKSEGYINIADVMQTTPTDNTPLGDYAAKGVGSSSGQFSYKTDKFGIFMVVSVIIPKILYTQGRDRMLQHLTQTSFFQPDFDRLGVQAIRLDELYSGQGTRSYSPDSKSTDVFGFTSRYAEYKCQPQDKLTGFFALHSLNGDNNQDVYHFTRYIDPDIDGKQVSLSFATSEGSQFDRIFAVNDSGSSDVPISDHFITIYHFNVECWQPMSKLFDDYEWSECNGKEQTQPIGGTQLD